MSEPTITVAGHRRRRAIRRFRVTVTAGPAAGATWNEPAERCAIGSHPSNDFVIEDPTVSRFHCELTVDASHLGVRDLGSRNGTLVGPTSIGIGRIAGGTELALGTTRVRIDVDEGSAEVAASGETSFGELIGASAAMREVFSALEKVAATDATVLIEGETGTGKEGAAEAIHDTGARASAPFVVIDCSAIPSTLLESELFGHEAGAFTGATARRIGAFERASGGTLFLDELGELPPDLQPKLLRALESHEIRRVGGVAPIECDLRIIAATNRDLRAEVNRGTFRADLYYRVAVVKIALPPLRERREDIPLLVTHLLARIGATPPIVAALTAPDFVAALSLAAWPGNVRELRNHLEQCVVFGERLLPNVPSAPHPTTDVDPSLPYDVARRQALDSFERAYLIGLLARCAGNVTAAARAAGVNRGYMHRLMRRHDVR